MGGGAYFLLVTNSVVRTTASLHLAYMGLRTDCLRTPSKALKSEKQILSSEPLLLSDRAANWPSKIFQN